jgi:glycine/D-amino acid oxidase-like deaminating enzyme
MRRRGFLAGVGAAYVTRGVARASAVQPPDQCLVPVRVSADSIIRTTTCLRPFRPGGFVLRRDTLGAKPIVHSYGHGGGGVSLSWGVASLGADLVGDVGERTAAVIGAGAVGLATARVLQDRGYRVAIYAAQQPLETTSSRAGAQWSPVSTFDPARRTQAYTDLWVRASTIAYRAFQDLLGQRYGVRWLANYELGDDPTQSSIVRLRDLGLTGLYPDYKVLGPGEHPFPTKYATRFETMLIAPPLYLAAVLDEFLVRGGSLTIRSFASPNELAALSEAIVFNCTGLGARELFGDATLTPVKGQLSVLLPQPEVTYVTLGPDNLYMFPRADGIVLGGTHQAGVSSLDVDAAAQTRIIADQARLFGGMRPPAAC